MRGTTFVRAVVAIAREKQITVDAASLAFYAANTLVALVILTYATVTSVGTENVLARALELLTGVGAVAFRRFLERTGSAAADQRRAVVIALVIAVWSSLRLFAAVESVFAEVYEVREERTFPRRVLASLLVLVAVAFDLLGMAVAASLFLFRAGGREWVLLGPVALWLALVALFGPVYYLLPGEDVSVREVLPGTTFAAAAWTVSAAGLRLYVGRSESVALYGVAGAVLLVLTWLYVVGLAMLVGVVLNAYLADRIEPEREWYPFAR